jgi:hypothetical protein
MVGKMLTKVVYRSKNREREKEEGVGSHKILQGHTLSVT